MPRAIQFPSTHSTAPAVRPHEEISEFPDQFPRLVGTGAMVLGPREQLRLYRVDCGGNCHCVQSTQDEYEIIEFAFPDDVIGFGYFPTHVSTAKAMAVSARMASHAGLDT